MVKTEVNCQACAFIFGEHNCCTCKSTYKHNCQAIQQLHSASSTLLEWVLFYLWQTYFLAFNILIWRGQRSYSVVTLLTLTLPLTLSLTHNYRPSRHCYGQLATTDWHRLVHLQIISNAKKDIYLTYSNVHGQRQSISCCSHASISYFHCTSFLPPSLHLWLLS